MKYTTSGEALPSGFIMQVKAAWVVLHVYGSRVAGCHMLHMSRVPTGSGGQAGCSREQLRDGTGSSELPSETPPLLHLSRGSDVLMHSWYHGMSNTGWCGHPFPQPDPFQRLLWEKLLKTTPPTSADARRAERLRAPP